MEQKVVLEMRGINGNFPGVKALQDVNFTLRGDKIRTLMGENGARKSTLIKVLTGVEELETDTIRMEESCNTIANQSLQEAQKNGIGTVYQEVNLYPNLSVAENLYIDREPKEGPMVNWRMMKGDARKLLEGLDVHIDMTMAVENYSIAIQQMIAIAGAVDMSAKVLILDEPTSSLNDGEVENLFVLVRQLRAEGIKIIFVTHSLEQIYTVCDRITVLRNGTLVDEFKMEELPRIQLVAKMMGKGFDDLAIIRKGGMSMVKEDVIISTRELGCEGAIRPFSLDIHEDEVVGLTGLLSSGRSELVRTIYGANKPNSGELAVKEKKLKVNAPIDAMVEGMAHLPESRKEGGIIADPSVRENIIVALQAKKGMFRLVSKKEQKEFAGKYIDTLQIKTADRKTPIKQLSGGDQQKVILGCWLLTSPDLLVLDEPTRGIDVGTRTEIWKLVLRLAEESMAMVFISSEIKEMLHTCSHMAVIRDGEKMGEFKEDRLSRDSIMRAVVGGGEE